MNQEYIYQDRVVVFIDVLGFQEKLLVFEQEAINQKREEGREFLVSSKLNEFVDAFNDAIGQMDKENLHYYLFSDNICITVDYVSNKHLLVSVLFTISELFYSFARKGYFLRGGIDVGKFVDEKRIAIGIPLSNAYLLESKDAIYPRILISDKFKKVLDENFSTDSQNSNYLPDLEYLIYTSCEFNYLNVFYNVIRKSDRLKFFQDLRATILENLNANNGKEKIFVKYTWLAREFNEFIDLYTSDIVFRDSNIETPPDEIQEIKNLKIIEYAICI